MDILCPWCALKNRKLHIASGLWAFIPLEGGYSFFFKLINLIEGFIKRKDTETQRGGPRDDRADTAEHVYKSRNCDCAAPEPGQGRKDARLELVEGAWRLEVGSLDFTAVSSNNISNALRQLWGNGYSSLYCVAVDRSIEPSQMKRIS